MFYSIGPYITDAEGIRSLPPTSVGGIELSAPGAAVPVVFIASTASLGAGYTQLANNGDVRTINANAVMRSRWLSATGFAATGSTMLALLLDHLTSGSAPLGLTACLPLVPTVEGDLEIWLGGHGKIFRRQFVWATDPHRPKLQTFIRRQLANWRRDVLDGILGGSDRLFHRRLAKKMMEKYGLTDFSEIRPLLAADWPVEEEPLEHDTTLTESFNNPVDSDTIGFDLTWTELNGDWDIAVATATPPTAQISTARCDSDLSGADHYVQVDILTQGTANGNGERIVGPLARKDSTATMTFYFCGLQNVASGTTVRLYKMEAGSATQVGSDATVTVGLPDTIRLTCNGSTISVQWNGSDVISETDTAISAGTRGGLRDRHSSAAPFVDNWEASDLADDNSSSSSASSSSLSSSSLSSLSSLSSSSLSSLSSSSLSSASSLSSSSLSSLSSQSAESESSLSSSSLSSQSSLSSSSLSSLSSQSSLSSSSLSSLSSSSSSSVSSQSSLSSSSASSLSSQSSLSSSSVSSLSSASSLSSQSSLSSSSLSSASSLSSLSSLSSASSASSISAESQSSLSSSSASSSSSSTSSSESAALMEFPKSKLLEHVGPISVLVEKPV